MAADINRLVAGWDFSGLGVAGPVGSSTAAGHPGLTLNTLPALALCESFGRGIKG
jgi:hypothetical protein